MVIIIIILILFLLYINNLESFKQDNRDWLQKIFDRRQIITIPSRLENVKNFCSSFRIKPTIFNAILKNDISYNNTYKLKLGEIACALSQEKVLQEFILSKDKTLIMFEDDIMSFDNIIYRRSGLKLKDIELYLKKSVKSLPLLWDVLYLGRCWDDCDNNIKINKYLVKTNHTLCHHAIVFSKSGAKKILNNISHPLKKPIDHIVASLCKSGIIDCYATVIPIFYQNRDDLSTTIGNFDNLPICKKRRKNRSQRNYLT